MDIHALEQLPRLVSQGKREGQRLAGAISGRHKERAIRDESIRSSDEFVDVAHRLLIGPPTLRRDPGAVRDEGPDCDRSSRLHLTNTRS